MATLDLLLKKQRSCYDNIVQLCKNYSKDPIQRKTVEYLEKRLEALESHWGEFCMNHECIMPQVKPNTDYVTEQYYNKTKTLYQTTRQKMLTQKLSLTVLAPTKTGRTEDIGMEGTPQDDADPQAKPETETNISEENKKLLQQQFFNFNAFEKTVSKIEVSSLEEKWELDDSLAMLKTRWEAIDKIHWQLDYALEDSTYADEYHRLEEIHDSLRKDINKKIWADTHRQKSTPKVDIPEFYGNYNKWVSFRDLYVETIHTSKWLTQSQKMQLLKSKLKGEPEKLVQHLNISADNYQSCWDILCNRYENKRLLCSSFINTLLSLPNIQVASASNLKKMHDTVNECVNGLTNIGVDVTTWDPILVQLLLPKLDSTTYGDYIHDLEDPRELPDLTEFIHFLEMKFMAFETVKHTQSNTKQEFSQKKQITWPQKSTKNYNNTGEQRATNFKRHEKWSNSYYATRQNCPLCKKAHTLMKCDTFNKMDVATRNENVARIDVCKNCLFSHNGKECVSEKKCRICVKNHHTLLHMDVIDDSKPSTSTQRAANNVTSDDTEVLLTTVQIMTKNAEGNFVTLRALLDQGSQVSLITENAAQRLRLKRRKLSAVISGVGTSLGNSKGLLTLECKSIHSDFTFSTDVLVMGKLVNNLPSITLTTTKWEHLQNLKLADPKFYVPGPIDILLGADIYSLIIQEGVVKQDSSSPVAQHTKLGWILCGNVNKTFNCFVTLNELENLNKFWETEEINEDNETAERSDYCEKHYVETTSRLSTGQYVVKMPMKENLEEKLGKSRPQAVAQFLQLEKKMARQTYFAQQYKHFIDEYVELGHMTPATRSTSPQLQAFLPHHGVVREESTTTKLRVVFNASMKTDSNYSLNDLMEKGPNLQKDILTLIIKWRSYKYALTADIEKMFRAIFLHEDQRMLQKIIWRSSPQNALREMELCTVTYGTKAAPFLAMRTLQQLADDEGHEFPMAEKALRQQFYMDDVITGHSTLEGARTLQKQLYELLRKGGFTLRKWATNDTAVLQDLPEEQKSQQNVFNFKQDTPTKTLGLGWNTTLDQFCFNWDLPARDDKITKRMLLSDISKLYDPLGWLAPIIVNTKLLFQQLWSNNLGWDEPIPNETAKQWQKIHSDLKHISKIYIPRWINSINERIELHGFCDASEKAYACVIYTKTTNERGDYVTTLLTAKTKVAPLNKKPSLPRLELCGALLLARLIEKVKQALSESEITIHCWTDSQVVLAWLQGGNKNWEKYVTNRTAMINGIVPAKQWRYVKSKENPADCATRGLLPSQLQPFDLWWNGPTWLKTEVVVSAETNMKFSTNEEGMTYECHVAQQTSNDTMKQLLTRCSTMTHATRCLAWVSRFIGRLKHINETNTTNYLKTDELKNANEMIVLAIQRELFADDVMSLQKNGTVNLRSKILNLTPFLDDKGILRVGGRLQNSTLSDEAKHPAILPQNCRLTELVVEHAHKQTLHGGARLTLAYTRQRFWIMGGTRAVKGILRLCVRCHRFRTTKNEQIMGNLPLERVTPARPFTHCGVDFTGHVDVKLNKGRGVKTSKGYIAIFICLVTKAVHIELVSDLSSQTFLAALKRLCSRRGTPKHMYSDNGTNFKGAARILQEFVAYKTITSPEFFKAINDQEIQWHFLCPHWPTAAGVWEAAVKSMKFHLKRVLGEQKLDYEQFTTLLAQIEACMNSRPLCPLTDNVEDVDALTPGHFLSGTPTLSLPQDDCAEEKIDLRNKWKMVEQMHQHIWRRWTNEYLHQLQTKSKWLKPKENICVDDLVLVKEDNLPPGKWAMARVLNLHPGADGYVRVVTLKTQNNVIKRPITKLAPLPKREMTDTSAETTKKDMPREQTATKRNNKTRSCKVGNYVTLLLLSLFTFLSTSEASTMPMTSTLKTTPIKDNQPIYFDEIGNLQLIHDEWTLIVYYNLTTFWQGTTKIKEYINNLDYLCKRTEKQPCEPIVSQLKHELDQLTTYNTLLLDQHLKRRKRGYINGVGNLARTLFGILDEDFAEKYQNDIERIQENENYLLQLIKNQTSIVETENSLIKTNENFMRQQLDVIHEYITKTNDTMSKIVYKVELMSTMNEINAASLTASLILANLKRTQELLLDTLMNIHNGHLDIHLLTPKQLVHELHMIAARISTRLTLPVKDVEEHLKDIYKLIYVKARVTQSYLLLEVHIPLTSDDDYQVFRVLPLPMYQPNNDTLTVNPTSTHIAVNFRKDTYISIGQEDLNQCVQINELSYICNKNYPISNLHSALAPCEAKILGQQTNPHCVTTKARCIDDWIKLHMTNRWLYFCCINCHARVICGNNIISTNAERVGVLDLAEGCVLQKKDTTLFAFNHFGSKVNIDPALPEVPNVNMHLTEEMHFNFSSIDPSATLNQSKLHDELDRLLKQQKQNEKLPNPEVTTHDVHQYIVTYLLVVVAAATAIYVLIKKCQHKRKTKNKRTEHTNTIQQTQPTTYRHSFELQQREPQYSQVAPKKPIRTYFSDAGGSNE